MSVGIPLTISN